MEGNGLDWSIDNFLGLLNVIITLGEILHELSTPIFNEKYVKMLFLPTL